jgi:Zn finger protein HypA/HybF involved in hydrogenase expression
VERKQMSWTQVKLKNSILGKKYCLCCQKFLKTDDFKGEKGKKKICGNCSKKLIKNVNNPWAYKTYQDLSYCDDCGTFNVKCYSNPVDNKLNEYKCIKCGSSWNFNEYTKLPKKIKNPKIKGNIALLRCNDCKKDFQQDDYKFKQTGRCPNCTGWNFTLLEYDEPIKTY